MNDSKSNALPTAERTRTPIRRQNAEMLLLITLLSFAASVSLTRLFLNLTGFPQIGNSELHFAHVLWGGLFLFAASLLPLLYANRWMLSLSALFAGVGVGLFIDEVGKFITQSNDYFYPAAAPIIYAFFLLTVLLFNRIRRPIPATPRAQLYYILQDLEEVLDHDLSPEERAQLITRLDHVIQSDSHSDLVQLAQSLRLFIDKADLHIVQHQPNLWERLLLRCQRFEQTYLTRERMRAILLGGMSAWSAYAIGHALSILLTVRSDIHLQDMLRGLMLARLVRSPVGFTFFELHVGLQGGLGLVLLCAALFMAIRQEKRAVLIAYVALLGSLTVVNLLLFYFDQFSTIVNAMVQFSLLLVLIRYRSRFMENGEMEV